MKGWMIQRNYSDYGDWNYEIETAFGVFLDRGSAERKVDELHAESRRKWEEPWEKDEQEILLTQRRWDVLAAAGLAVGDRPEFPAFWEETKEAGWRPGADQSDWWEVYEVDVHPSFEAEEEMYLKQQRG